MNGFIKRGISNSFPGGSVVKNPPAMQVTWVRSLGQEDPLEKEMGIHFSILAWEIPWTEEPSGLPSTGSQRPRQSLVTKQHNKNSNNFFQQPMARHWKTYPGHSYLFIIMLQRQLQQVAYIQTFRLWNFKMANMHSHIQSCKLVHVFGIHCTCMHPLQVVVFLCTWLYSAVESTAVQYL